MFSAQLRMILEKFCLVQETTEGDLDRHAEYSSVYQRQCSAFSALTMLDVVGRQEGHPAYKN